MIELNLIFQQNQKDRRQTLKQRRQHFKWRSFASARPNAAFQPRAEGAATSTWRNTSIFLPRPLRSRLQTHCSAFSRIIEIAILTWLRIAISWKQILPPIYRPKIALLTCWSYQFFCCTARLYFIWNPLINCCNLAFSSRRSWRSLCMTDRDLA